jgi:hypothetical protein
MNHLLALSSPRCPSPFQANDVPPLHVANPALCSGDRGCGSRGYNLSGALAQLVGAADQGGQFFE